MPTINSKHLWYPNAPVTGKEKEMVLWKDDISVSGAFLVRFEQSYLDDHTMTFKAKTLIENPVHVGHSRFSSHWRSGIMNNAHTVAGFIPFGNLESPERFDWNDVVSIHCSLPVPCWRGIIVLANIRGFRLVQKMEMLQKAQRMFFQPMNWDTLSFFSSTLKDGIVRTCILLLCYTAVTYRRSKPGLGLSWYCAAEAFCELCCLMWWIQDMRTAQVRTNNKLREVQKCMKDILASHKSLEHLEYQE